MKIIRAVIVAAIVFLGASAAYAEPVQPDDERAELMEAKVAAAKRQRQEVTATESTPPVPARIETPAPAPPSGDIWAALAQCEAWGTNANTGNGYYGYFQFALGTWDSVGGTGYPHEHDYATQLKYAKILQAQGGWGHWPACARKLGLL